MLVGYLLNSKAKFAFLILHYSGPEQILSYTYEMLNPFNVDRELNCRAMRYRSILRHTTSFISPE